jgi:predicted ATPase
MVHELHIKGGCRELPLQPLSEAAVAAYLAQRWADIAPLPPSQFVRAVYHRTEGHPLFLGHVVDYLKAQEGVWRSQSQPSDEALGSLLRTVPRDLHRMIETQVASFTSAVQRILEVASVAGVEFSTPAVAAGGEMEIEFVEEHCAELARHGHFLQERGLVQWPDMTIGTGYRFVHALYQEVLYQRVPVRQRMAMHQRMGLRYEQAYDGQTVGMAPELALHFTQGREFRRAVLYRRQAAEIAMRRSAYQEAIAHLTHGLDILQELPDAAERLQQELTLRTSLGPALMATKGYAAAEVQAAYAQAQELCSQVPESPQLFPVLFGLWGFYLVRAEYARAQALAQQLLKVAQGTQDPGLLVEAHGALGVTAFYTGHLLASQAHLAQGLQYYDPVQHRAHALLYGQDPWVACRMWEGQVLWLLGYPDQALQCSQEAFAYAQELAHPFSTVFALYGLALVHQLRQESAACHECATMQLRLSEEQGFPFWAGPGAILLGWALAEQGHAAEGCQRLCDGLAMRQAMGAAQPRPYFSLLLAQVYGRVGKVQEALEVLRTALEGAADIGERWCEAELYRLQGELLLQATGVAQGARGRPQAGATVHRTESEAEVCFQKALVLAQHQGAQGWALRATLSLSQLWARQGKQTEARHILGKMHSTLPPEGMQTADRQESSRLLAQWA